MMFEAFEGAFRRDGRVDDSAPSTVPILPGLSDFFDRFGGTTFRGGLYRVIHPAHLIAWQTRVLSAFPEFQRRIICFGFDWLGRAFALDPQRLDDGQAGVLMLEPGTGEALEIPCNLITFHNAELLEFGEAALAISFYDKWRAAGGGAPAHDQCVGYRKPLFLGGRDEVENLELSDIDVYWHLMGQLITERRGLPPGTPIRIAIEE